jgi:hypothetical protein
VESVGVEGTNAQNERIEGPVSPSEPEEIAPTYVVDELCNGSMVST